MKSAGLITRVEELEEGDIGRSGSSLYGDQIERCAKEGWLSAWFVKEICCVTAVGRECPCLQQYESYG